MAIKSPTQWLKDFVNSLRFIEVLIVLAIVGIILAVTIPAYQDHKARMEGRPTYHELAQQRDAAKTCK